MIRSKNRAIAYLRRSGSKQESSLETQLHWARQKATSLQVLFDTKDADLEEMRQEGLNRKGSLFIDDDTGSELERPGLQAMLVEALNDKSISHVLVYKRDRLSRSEDVPEMMKIERKLIKAGIALHFMDGEALPSQSGGSNMLHDIQMLFGYHQGHDYLINLADRIVDNKRFLAQQGFRIGGNAPYGFARVLIGPDGEEKEILPQGRTVREPGHHVQIRPDDRVKIAVWLLILDLRHEQGWGCKRIANHLNAAGIPSPDANRTRTDHGVRHVVSGKWCANTVAELCRNPAILGMQHGCRRAEGMFRRQGQTGPRMLEERDRLDTDKPRVILNDEHVVIKASGGYAPLYDVEKWHAIQARAAERSKHQRGVRRAHDPAKYPLSGLVFDLTDGCGANMVGVTRGQRRLYLCGRYANIGKAACENNAVDAEALFRFVLRSLKHLMYAIGGRDKVRDRLSQKAEAAQSDSKPHAIEGLGVELKDRVERLTRDLATVERRIATIEDDDLVAAMRSQRAQIKEELRTATVQRQEQERLLQPQAKQAPHEEVESAMAVFDHLHRIAVDGKARAEVAPLLERLGIRIGLAFKAGIKGKKRTVRCLESGVLALGHAPLPVPIHGRHNRDPRGSSSQELGSTATQNVTRIENNWPADHPTTGDVGGEPAGPTIESPREGISSSKVNRGDRI